MNRHFFRILTLLVTALTGWSTTGLSAASFDEKAHGFTITLPDGWQAIPREILENYSAQMASRSGGKVKEQYALGYQRGYQGQWLVHPYILVQVKETGRIPDGQLRQMKSFHAGAERGLNKASDSLGGLLTSAALGETLYDATNRCIWMHYTIDLAGVGSIKGVTCGFLTEKGMLLFHCYGRSSEFSALLPVFQQALASVKISEALKYRPRLGDGAGLDFSRVIRAAIIGGIIGGSVLLALGLVVRLTRKKKPAPDPGFPPAPPPS